MIRLYVNGVEVSYAVQNAASGNLQSEATHAMYLGAYDLSKRWFDGSMDDVKIFDRALSSVEVWNEFNGPSPDNP